MEEKIKELVDMLLSIKKFTAPDLDGISYASNNDPNMEMADELACELLIDEMGFPKYDIHMELRDKYGFKVLPGDVDSFGWLTGVIVYPDDTNKRFVFG